MDFSNVSALPEGGDQEEVTRNPRRGSKNPFTRATRGGPRKAAWERFSTKS
jgi:hypothetical protein